MNYLSLSVFGNCCSSLSETVDNHPPKMIIRQTFGMEIFHLYCLYLVEHFMEKCFKRRQFRKLQNIANGELCPAIGHENYAGSFMSLHGIICKARGNDLENMNLRVQDYKENEHKSFEQNCWGCFSNLSQCTPTFMTNVSSSGLISQSLRHIQMDRCTSYCGCNCYFCILYFHVQKEVISA